MKILLVGEYSGVHNNLKNALVKQGHEVFIAASGDAYRNYPVDINLKPYKCLKPISQLLNAIYVLLNIRKLLYYDVVQFVTPFAFPPILSYLGFYNLILAKSKMKIYYACGTDPYFLSAIDKFKYFPFDDPEDKAYPRYSKLSKLHYKMFIKNVDVIIPAMYGYGVAHGNNLKSGKPIRLPVSLTNTQPQFEVSDKIKILHGITRGGVKGSSYIIAALRRIEKDFSANVEVILVERLAFSNYTKLLEEVDVVVDQCKSYSYGMNALFAMSKGAIVLSGSEPEAMEYVNVENCPIINIIPDEDQIYSTLVNLIESRDNIQTMKEKSWDFVKKYHDADLIADEFIKTYKA